MIDVDFIQRVKVGGIFCLQIYKILTGTLLTLFIPQSCEVVTNNVTENRICSLEQNYENGDIYHQKTLYWNILTMTLFIGYYCIELKRENWSIKYLDIDNDQSDNGLKEIIVKEKKLDNEMDRLNKYYYYTVLVTGISYFINILLMIKIIKDDYHSSTTISCFVSFSLLVLMKLYNSFVVAKESVKNDKMMSAYMSENVSFNVLDADYLENKNKKIKNRP
tara:strand:- start:52 stop:711 length:660 start_codon:yes stop_codon:yes gene_type:complete